MGETDGINMCMCL